jgi:hypothetical protein
MDEWLLADLIKSGDVVRQTEPEPAKVAAVVENIEKAAEKEASSYTSRHGPYHNISSLTQRSLQRKHTPSPQTEIAKSSLSRWKPS